MNDATPINDRGEPLETYMGRMRPATASNVLLWVILAFVAIFFVWAALTELDRTVRGQGRIIPSSQLQVVSNLEGGIVEAILVRTGQIVRRGDPVVRLDQTATSAALGSNQAKFDALRAKIARLEGEISGRAPVFPVGGGAGLAEQVAIERGLHAARMADLSSLLSAYGSSVNGAQRSVAEARATFAARQSALSARQSELTLIRPLVERGIEPRLSLVQAENAAAVASSEAAAASASIARYQAGVAEASSKLAQARQDWRATAAGELALAQGEMVALRRSLPAYSAQVDRTVVRSPLAGRVNRVLVTTVGGSVGPGAPLVEIVPSEDSLFVEAQILPQDIAWVRMNQDAKIDITAYDSSVYGTLDGKVVSISPDATLNERTGETFYTVRVATSDRLLNQAGRPLEIGPGMVANVSLLGDKRTVLGYIFSPITKLGESALRED